MTPFDINCYAFHSTEENLREKLSIHQRVFSSKEEYVPIIFLIGDGGSCRSDNYYFGTHDLNGRKYRRIRDIITFKGLKFVDFEQSRRLINIEPELERFEKGLKIYLKTQNIIIYDLHSANRGYGSNSYEDINRIFFQNTRVKKLLQSTGTMITGKGILYRVDTREIIMSIMVRSDLIEYQKLHMLTTGVFDYSAMELWINPELDTPLYPYQGLRRMFRRNTKLRAEELGLPIVETLKVNTFDKKIEIPQAVSIDDLNQWKKELYSFFREEEHKQNMNVTF